MPIPTTNQLSEFYAKTYYQAPQLSTYQVSYDNMELNYKKLKSEALIHALSSNPQLDKQSFLDIGAGEGFLLNSAHEKGFDVTGLDFSAFGIEKYFPELLTKHIAGDLFTSLSKFIEQGKKFSLCTSTNVLEHVIDPDLFLDLVKKVMAPNASLALTVPNDFSDIQNLLMDESMIDREFWFVPPQHLHYFNSENLPPYLIKHGFDIVDAFSDFPVDLYLLHKESNYIMKPASGLDANRARMHHDLMIYRKYGVDRYLEYYRAMYRVGLGRDITVIVRSKGV
jgi:2-polyprenyl-3-methyl-5-hydroxy-6-metoxy-1,4-benzoquinol methylase